MLNSVYGHSRFVYPKQSENICPNCKFALFIIILIMIPYWGSDPYGGSQHTRYPAVIMASYPCIVNSNSMKNVQECLHHLHDITNILKDREWMVLCFIKFSEQVKMHLATCLVSMQVSFKFGGEMVDWIGLFNDDTSFRTLAVLHK